jgi:hypothetical protein
MALYFEEPALTVNCGRAPCNQLFYIFHYSSTFVIHVVDEFSANHG